MKTHVSYLNTALILILAASVLLLLPVINSSHAQSDSKGDKTPADNQTLDSILKSYQQAIGGRKGWEEMESFKVTGKMKSLGTVFDTTVVYKRPNLCRLDFTANNMNFVESYDGTTPWQLGIASKSGKPVELEGKRAEELEQTCDFDGPLVDPKRKGIKLEYEGKEEIEGKTGYKIKVTYKNGSVDTYYLNEKTYLPYLVIGTTMIKDQSFKSTTRIGDFIQTGDIKIAYYYEFELEGVPQNEIFTISTVEINPEIKKDFFSMPRDVKNSY